jgi:hypothetical protein
LKEFKKLLYQEMLQCVPLQKEAVADAPASSDAASGAASGAQI